MQQDFSKGNFAGVALLTDCSHKAFFRHMRSMLSKQSH